MTAYYNEDPELDSDIISSHKNVKMEEKKLGHNLSKDFGEKSQYSLMQREKLDNPTSSSDDGWPSCSGWCPKTRAAK
jgi:hypothetical protein